MKKYLLTGLLVWTPLAITVWVLSWLLGAMDGLFAWLLSAPQALLPASAHASIEKLRHVPGLGVLVMGLGLLLTGVFATNIFGQWWLRQWNRLLHKIPIVRSVYSSVKQVSDTLFSSSGNAFREAVLVQYPRQGSWTIAFVTGKPGGEVAHHLHQALAVAQVDEDHAAVVAATVRPALDGDRLAKEFFVNQSAVVGSHALCSTFNER